MGTITRDYNERLYWQFRTAEEAVEVGNDIVADDSETDHYKVIRCSNHWALDLYEADGYYIGRY